MNEWILNSEHWKWKETLKLFWQKIEENQPEEKLTGNDTNDWEGETQRNRK